MPDRIVKRRGRPKRKALPIRQYSFLAFARFYYNRICSTIEGDYDPLPPLSTSKAPAASRSATMPAESPRSVLRTGERMPRDRNVAKSVDGGGESSVLDRVPETKEALMRQLRVALIPWHESPRHPEVLVYATESQLSFANAAKAPRSRAAIITAARRRTATSALYGLLKAG